MLSVAKEKVTQKDNRDGWREKTIWRHSIFIGMKFKVVSS